MSAMKAWRICETALKTLPNNNQFSYTYCSKFSKIFVFDGKYVPVASASSDWALLWGVDYLTHDIPVIFMAPSESYHSWSRLFFYFRLLSHYPELVVLDDNLNAKMAARYHFPKVKIQTCFNHFKENIRRTLHVRSDSTYVAFMRKIEQILKRKLSDQDMDKQLFLLYQEYQHDPITLTILTNIAKYRPELTGYRGIAQAPITTNIIEGFNSHLEARLQKIRSFQTPAYAKLWLNGYVLKRRFTQFTDCRGKFRHLNGKRGVDVTKKPGIDLPNLF